MNTTHDLIVRYLDLAETIEELQGQQASIKAQLRETIGVGEKVEAAGVTVSVTPPSRRFNLDKAVRLLTEEQVTVCSRPDARLVKAQLPEVLLDSCYDAGKGDPIVRVS